MNVMIRKWVILPGWGIDPFPPVTKVLQNRIEALPAEAVEVPSGYFYLPPHEVIFGMILDKRTETDVELIIGLARWVGLGGLVLTD